MDSKFLNITEIIDDLCKKLDKLEQYGKECSNKLSDCDKLITDIQHCLELEKLSASQIVQLGVKERDALIERRKIKNELDFIKAISEADSKVQLTVNRLYDIKNAYANQLHVIKDKSYTPRIDSSLFTKNVAKTDTIKQKPLEYVDYNGKKRTIGKQRKTSIDEKFELIEAERLKRSVQN